jgi:hypothetical protein
MPYVTNGNIHTPVMMAAEKAADLILGDVPLPPKPVPFFRHGQDQGLSSWNPGPFGRLKDLLFFLNGRWCIVQHHNVGFFIRRLDRPAVTSR